MSKRTSLALLAAGIAATAAAGAFALGLLDGGARRAPDPRFATPRDTLNEYVRAVLAVDEEAELSTAAPELRARTERQRGPDKEARRESLKGKAGMFRAMPIEAVSERIWGDRARILLTQGGPPENPVYYVYSFRLVNGEWKITGMDIGRDMKW